MTIKLKTAFGADLIMPRARTSEIQPHKLKGIQGPSYARENLTEIFRYRLRGQLKSRWDKKAFKTNIQTKPNKT